MPAMLTIKGARKTFNAGSPNEVRALQGVDLAVDESSFVIVIGTNGSGKSTLLNAVAGAFLLDAGTIAQEGPPTALYNNPATLFTAEFMGSNNRLDGTLVENSGGRATIEVFGTRITGKMSGLARSKAAVGSKATAITRLEHVRCGSSAGPNRLKMELKAPMYLGERWELVFAREHLTVRAYASTPLQPGEHYVEFPADTLWVF